jgi:hypothetical protein
MKCFPSVLFCRSIGPAHSQPRKHTLSRRSFTGEEDAQLLAILGPTEFVSWEAIAEQIPGRTARQCRERWKHYLSGNRIKTPWSAEESRLLYEKMQTIGPKWTRIAIFFPGRTDIEVKAYWMQHFACLSSLHIRNRQRRPPAFQPTVPQQNPPAARVHFAGAIPKAPTPRGEFDAWFKGPSRDPSFGSRSCFDFSAWD